MAPTDPPKGDAAPPSIPEPLDPKARPFRRRFASLRVMSALMLREMSSEYGRSPGGYIWALIEPLGMIAVMALGFSLMLRNPPLGTSFMLFYASGYLPFTAAREVEIKVSAAIIYSRPLLHFPTVTWVDAILARFLLNALNQALFSFLLLVAILLFIDTTSVLDVETLVLAMGLALFYGLAIGVLQAYLLHFELWNRIYRVLTRPLFLASGVLYTFEILPDIVQSILWWNPLVHIVGLMRRGLYSNYQGDYVSVTYVVALGLLMLAAGVLLLSAYAQDIISDE